jgi:hypothetical protein
MTTGASRVQATSRADALVSLDVPTVHVAGCTLAVEENGDAVFAQTPIGVARDHEATVATGNSSDVPSPTATVTGSGALLVKNVVVHISLSP